MFKEELKPIFPKLFQEIKVQGTLTSPRYKPVVHLYQNQLKTSQDLEDTDQYLLWISKQKSSKTESGNI